VESNPITAGFPLSFILPFYLALAHWRKIGQNEAEKLSEFNWRFSAFSPKAA